MIRQIQQQWYSGHEILNMGVKGFELLEAVKGNKLIPHDKHTGKKVVDYDTLPRRPMTLEQVETVVARSISTAPPPLNQSRAVKYRAISRTKQIKATAKRIYENERPEIPIQPKDCIVDHFTLESVKGFIYTTDEVSAFLTESSSEPQPDIAPHTEPIAKDDTETKMQEARKKGGRAKKKNMAIFEAAKQFISHHPKLTTASEIGRIFKKYKSLNPLKIDFDSIHYEVYCDGEKKCKVYSVSPGRDKGKYHDKSISYSTLQAKYIPQAKKEVESSKSNNT